MCAVGVRVRPCEDASSQACRVSFGKCSFLCHVSHSLDSFTAQPSLNVLLELLVLATSQYFSVHFEVYPCPLHPFRWGVVALQIPLGLARTATVVDLAAEDERDERLLDACEAPA